MYVKAGWKEREFPTAKHEDSVADVYIEIELERDLRHRKSETMISL